MHHLVVLCTAARAVHHHALVHLHVLPALGLWLLLLLKPALASLACLSAAATTTATATALNSAQTFLHGNKCAAYQHTLAKSAKAYIPAHKVCAVRSLVRGSHALRAAAAPIARARRAPSAPSRTARFAKDTSPGCCPPAATSA